MDTAVKPSREAIERAFDLYIDQYPTETHLFAYASGGIKCLQCFKVFFQVGLARSNCVDHALECEPTLRKVAAALLGVVE